MRLEHVSNKSSGQPFAIELEANEVRALRAALGEVCFGFRLEEFTAHIGMGEERACMLFERLNGLDLNRRAVLPTTPEELLALRNAHAETLKELGVEEYSTRTGLDFQEGEALLRALDENLGSCGIRRNSID